MDRLAELEKVILDYHLDKGYQVGVGHWGFEVTVESKYKEKKLVVIFWDDSYNNKIKATHIYSDVICETTQEMFDEAIKFFKGAK